MNTPLPKDCINKYDFACKMQAYHDSCPNLSYVKNAVIKDIDLRDVPDFCDAYLESADLESPFQPHRSLTEEEIAYINEECRDFVYECITAQIR